MKFLDTPHKKKSAGLTLLTAILLLLFFFVLGLTYYDPPVSYGVEVNFGTSALGSGEVQPQKVVAATSTPNENPTKTEKSTPKDIPQPQKTPSSEPILSEKESTVSLPKKKNTIKSTTSTEEKKETPPKKIEPQVSEVTKSVVSNLVKNTSQKAEGTQGQGEDMESGDKGKEEGSPYASSYYNNAGLGGISKGYGLNGRNLQSNGKVVQECNQEGTVVVRITVNKQGDVITAEPGVKGSTNTHPCLLTPAKETALLHKWYPDNKAPEQQIGFVVIQFKLGE